MVARSVHKKSTYASSLPQQQQPGRLCVPHCKVRLKKVKFVRQLSGLVLTSEFDFVCLPSKLTRTHTQTQQTTTTRAQESGQTRRTKAKVCLSLCECEKLCWQNLLPKNLL